MVAESKFEVSGSTHSETVTLDYTHTKISQEGLE